MGAMLQPPSLIQATAQASSTEADELSPAPRGTSEASAAFKPSREKPASSKAQATPAGYLAQLARGVPSEERPRARPIRSNEAASWSKSAAMIVERAEPE